MVHTVRVVIAALLITLALLGTGLVASSTPPVFVGGPSGDNGGG